MAQKCFWLVAPAIFAPAFATATQYLTIEQAKKIVFPDATIFQDLTTQPKLFSQISSKQTQILKVFGSTEPLGFMIIDNVIGKHELITYAFGVTTSGIITGVEILDYRENHGSEVRDLEWREQFKGKKREDRLKLGNNIKNITGATLSCRHITEGINHILDLKLHENF